MPDLPKQLAIPLEDTRPKMTFGDSQWDFEAIQPLNIPPLVLNQIPQIPRPWRVLRFNAGVAEFQHGLEAYQARINIAIAQLNGARVELHVGAQPANANEAPRPPERRFRVDMARGGEIRVVPPDDPNN